ncbi:hypothetical protein SAMN04488543_2750 [Friedmanniella luteola]|uniref:Uncharacterized protein n=1 Tax=Friedmanniella luteola TaxID=546871 RepID=A0A1H1WJH1_9ACTN|nr:hypothetical protein [Friedmanniella luteola]SDS97293.1 hypothetical protein SAMN04488543_2750 [Friedmanniella luteola]
MHLTPSPVRPSGPITPSTRRPDASATPRRARGLLVAAIAALSLVPALATPAAAADPAPVPPCPGPAQTILDVGDAPSVAVGTTKTQKLRFTLYTRTGCDAAAATAAVRTPQGTRTVRLEEVSRDAERVQWRGALSIAPRSLRNEDAGRWRTTFRVAGPNPDSRTVNSNVRRAVRISFNAGPEPVRNGRITYSGHLERASWDTRTYRDLARRVVSIYQIRLDEEDMDEIAATRTGADGRYRLTRPYSGPGFYVGVYDGTRYTSARWSRRDRVDTPG